MIELSGLSFGYDDQQVLRDVDLVLEDGEFVVVAGRTGVGKSTLLGTFNGLVPQFTGGTLTGDVLVDGRSVVELPPRERAHLVGYVGQDPAAGFVTDTVEEELAYGMEQLGLDAATMRRRVEETLDLLGLAELRDRDLATLSGGQQQRVAIGSVLPMHPRLLVLDEPTSALDSTAAEEVLATLTRLAHDVGITVLIAEHRLERVVPFADRLCLIEHRGLRVGPPAEVLREAPVVPPIVALGRLAGWDPLPLSVREARRRARGWTSTMAPPQVSVGSAARPVLEVRGVSVSHGRRPAVRDVDLSVAAGEILAVMGRNGSGKSTLLWTIQGSKARDRGSVRVAGSDPAKLAPGSRRTLSGLVPQTAADLLYLETVAEECAAADHESDRPAGSCRTLLERLVPGVPDDRHPRDLSEGQRLALVLAIVLTAEPPLVLLDEPTRGLDYPGKEALARILAALAAEGRAVLVATHDVEFVAEVADRVVVLAEGEVVSSGPTAAVVAETPAFAPQVSKILGPEWLTVAQVSGALR
ncbi:ABC transporter ATP-binding protein [Nocardioides mesophilus]|uniref:ATP-binding cassette domain-containing protein n=1 Tax=Nocardioides mesophilus TaxID=433659 RepID=A0A7G9R8X2_9ACTN|nr:ABC transporter ATP-binding protein [Nocardioides mesophilus]QNN52047.1 ATP-binding cassette domain-containing protein [Nocardioides mesophilus]